MNFSIIFPGQGSQSVGMMHGLSEYPIVRQTFEEASDILGVDFWHMAIAENDLINDTSNTQPIMLTAGIAVWRLWMSEVGQIPLVMAGHSLGEYTALTASGVLSFDRALPLVKYRAEIMQEAVPEGAGAMAAILGLDDELVIAACNEVAQGQTLQAVNFNAPGQVVIAGHAEAVDRGMLMAKEKGAKKAVKLPVSVPSHCELMKSAAKKLEEYLTGVVMNSPQIPVINNAEVEIRVDVTEIKTALVKQLYSPVRWVESINKMVIMGTPLSFECGPGKILSGLGKRITTDMPTFAVTDMDSMQNAIVLLGNKGKL